MRLKKLNSPKNTLIRPPDAAPRNSPTPNMRIRLSESIPLGKGQYNLLSEEMSEMNEILACSM